MDYVYHILILINIYVMAAVGLSMLSGSTGLVSLSQAAFFGIGAYGVAILTTVVGLSFPLAAVVAVGIDVSVAILLGSVGVRHSREMFVVTTIGFQAVLYNLMLNWTSLTNGPLGIAGIGSPCVFGLCLDSQLSYFLVTLGFALVCVAIRYRLITAPFGAVIRAIREDEGLTSSFGKDVSHYKSVTFATSACLAGVAGVLYASYISFIDPSSFTIVESVFFLSIVILGGADSLWGPVFATMLLVALPEGLRATHIPGPLVGNLRQMIVGLILVLMMVYRPQGLLTRYLGRNQPLG